MPLTFINLQKNNLNGNIPDLSALTKLKTLALDYNYLTGSVPSSIGSLTSLTYLSLNNNWLTGSLPSSLGNLVSLKTLDLSNNNFNMEFPNWMYGLTQLTYLSVWGCGMSGTFPDVTTSLKNLETVYPAYDSQQSAKPGELGIGSESAHRWFNYNQHTGPIPSGFANLQHLETLDMGVNYLSGPIPAFGIQINMTYLSLGKNALSGPIPDSLGNLYNVQWLYLNDNKLSGAIPTSIGSMISMTELRLNNNSLTGSLPDSIGNVRKLEVLRVDMNKLSGDFPASLGNLSLLKELNVSGNCITGQLPSSLLTKFNGLGVQYSNCPAAPSPNGASSSSSVPVAAIAGGVVGGIFAIALIVVGVFFVLRKRKSDKDAGNGYPVVVGKESLEGYASAGKAVNASLPMMMSGKAQPAYMPAPTGDVDMNQQAFNTQQAIPLSPPRRNQSYVPQQFQQNQPPVMYPSDSKQSSLFDVNARPPVTSYTHYQRGDMKEKFDPTSPGGSGNLNVGGGGSLASPIDNYDIEAALQNHMGPYYKWTGEQVIAWAREKKFDQAFINALQENQVDGAILHSIDRETLKSDLGVSDFRTRAKVFKSIEVLREHLHSRIAVNDSIVIASAGGGGGGGGDSVVAPPAYSG
ncbi:hypothetical protein HDU76_009048 [Blyttiomyces sp. JEL0837]|nr:hypothetical protein HDU76_009048 [Blyttiomyces sp. JEL0837]